MAQQKIFGITVGKPDKKVVKQPMNPEVKASHTFTPTVPRVNLIPSQFTEKYEVQHLVRNFGILAFVLILFIGGAWGGAQVYMGAQSAKIEALNTEQQTLLAETATLQPYQTYETAVNAKRDLFQETTRNDINMGLLYEDVNDASAAAQVDIRSLRTIQYQPGTEGADCVNPDPFATTTSNFAVAGCLVFQGGATSLESTLLFLDQMVAEGDTDGDFYRNPYVSSFTATLEPEDGALPNEFNATLFFTDALYSNTYVDFFNAAGAELAEETGPTFIEAAANLLGTTLTAEDTSTLNRLSGEVCAPQFNIDTQTEISTFVLTIETAAVDADNITTQLVALMEEQCDTGGTTP